LTTAAGNEKSRGVSNKKVSGAKAKRGTLADASFAQTKSHLLREIIHYKSRNITVRRIIELRLHG